MGLQRIDDPAFRQSLYALTAELHQLQPLLVAPQVKVTAKTIDDLFDPPKHLGVRANLRGNGPDWLLIVVNEDAHRHLGVEVHGLEPLEGRQLYQLYGSDRAQVLNGSIVLRMQGHEVRLYSTNRDLESEQRDGREYVD